MRGWYAVLGVFVGLLCFLGVVLNPMFPSGAILSVMGLIFIVGSVVYGVVWSGLVRGVYAVLSGLLGLLLVGVGVWILDFPFKVFSILFGLALLVGFVVYSVVWVVLRVWIHKKRGD